MDDPLETARADVGIPYKNHERYAAAMRRALEVSRRCEASDDVPVGAVLLDAGGTIVAEGWNRREELGDPTAHAEIEALRRVAPPGGIPSSGGQAGTGRPFEGWRRGGTTLVVTLEPCVMCAGALVAARVQRVVFGAWDVKAGACGGLWDMVGDPAAVHRVEVVGGVMADDCAGVLLDFFGARRVSRRTTPTAGD